MYSIVFELGQGHNQIFHYTCCITLMRLTSWLGLNVPAGNTTFYEELLSQWRAVHNTVFDLTGLRFEPPTSRSRGDHVTA